MEHITTLDANGIGFIKSFEGFRGIPYLDSAGVATIGYGSTYYEDGTKVTMQDAPITQQHADAMFLHNLKHYELGVDAMTRDDISQGMFNALVSFSYNEGLNKLKGSHLLMKINANPQDPAIRDEFLKWKYAGGEIVDGLLRRREAEADMFFA